MLPMTLDEWLDVVAGEINPPIAVTEDVKMLLLDLIRDVAHQATRPGAPLTAFLLGTAVGAGGDLPALVDRLRAKLPPAETT